MPSVGLGRAWHVLERRLHGFMLSAPCGFLRERILYNQSAKRLRAALLGRKHTVVAVPYRREEPEREGSLADVSA
jgi:hypothetical protein